MINDENLTPKNVITVGLCLFWTLEFSAIYKLAFWLSFGSMNRIALGA